MSGRFWFCNKWRNEGSVKFLFSSILDFSEKFANLVSFYLQLHTYFQSLPSLKRDKFFLSFEFPSLWVYLKIENSKSSAAISSLFSPGSAINYCAGTFRGRPCTSTLTHTTEAIPTISNVFTNILFSNHSAGSQRLLLISVNMELKVLQSMRTWSKYLRFHTSQERNSAGKPKVSATQLQSDTRDRHSWEVGLLSLLQR